MNGLIKITNSSSCPTVRLYDTEKPYQEGIAANEIREVTLNKITEPIHKYSESDLLRGRIHFYNRILAASIKYSSWFGVIAEDARVCVIQHLSLKDEYELSRTCCHLYRNFQSTWKHKLVYSQEVKEHYARGISAERLFREYPKYRLDKFIPVDQLGIEYLQNGLGVNCGPFTINKIRNGQLTICQAQRNANEKFDLEGLRKKMEGRFGWLSNVILNSLQKYICDGSVTIEQLLNSPYASSATTYKLISD